MKEEEIIFAYVEGFLRKVIEAVDEMSHGMYTVEFEIKKVQIGGKNA
jgi:hypothetical protein